MREVLDLHGFPPRQVPDAVREFIRSSLEEGRLEVRIAHGKGRSVLKAVVLRVLRADDRVESFGDAPPQRGGWGSTLVRLREPPGG
jgi:DNA-nicking Smr family endonuclease